MLQSYDLGFFLFLAPYTMAGPFSRTKLKIKSSTADGNVQRRTTTTTITFHVIVYVCFVLTCLSSWLCDPEVGVERCRSRLASRNDGLGSHTYFYTYTKNELAMGCAGQAELGDAPKWPLSILVMRRRTKCLRHARWVLVGCTHTSEGGEREICIMHSARSIY